MKWTRPGSLGWRVKVESEPLSKLILERWGEKSSVVAVGLQKKICDNMILGVTTITTCEAFVLAEKLELSHQALCDVASVSSRQSQSLTSRDGRRDALGV
jgi:3-hydroxyisobutyrate dehydrogenase-like beta-hydroxyacid dehydrogenase